MLRGTRVVCAVSRIIPEHISKRTGLLKPLRVDTKVVTGVVQRVGWNGKLVVKVGETLREFFAHEVIEESKFNESVGK